MTVSVPVQVIHELKVFLLVGRTLVLPSAGGSLEVSMIKTMEFMRRGSVIRQRVDLLFPAPVDQQHRRAWVSAKHRISSPNPSVAPTQLHICAGC